TTAGVADQGMPGLADVLRIAMMGSLGYSDEVTWRSCRAALTNCTAGIRTNRHEGSAVPKIPAARECSVARCGRAGPSAVPGAETEVPRGGCVRHPPSLSQGRPILTSVRRRRP